MNVGGEHDLIALDEETRRLQTQQQVLLRLDIIVTGADLRALRLSTSVRGYRPDKDPVDVDTIETVQALLLGKAAIAAAATSPAK